MCHFWFSVIWLIYIRSYETGEVEEAIQQAKDGESPLCLRPFCWFVCVHGQVWDRSFDSSYILIMDVMKDSIVLVSFFFFF